MSFFFWSFADWGVLDLVDGWMETQRIRFETVIPDQSCWISYEKGFFSNGVDSVVQL